MEEFLFIDGVVLLLYFGAMAAMGPIFMSKSRTTEGYFLGDRSFPGWLIGFSMFATSISSITFMAYPADAYKTAWLRFTPNVMLPVAILIASHFFLPFFRRGRITSAYEYLEGRFGPNVRLYAALAFILTQIIRISLILFLVSQLVETITGLPSVYSVFLGGIITSFYTITGGIRAVLWTDFIQALVLWAGGLICIFVIAFQLGGFVDGFGTIFEEGMAAGKFALADLEGDQLVAAPVWSLDLTQKTVLLMLLMGLGNWLTEYSANQNVIQRYCASRSAKQARVAMWVCCWFSIPTWALFMFLGTALYVFYQHHPTPEAMAMLSGEAKPEGILPYFVVRSLPPGVTGLVIAAVLAAAMSSISSSINSVSAVSIVDVYRRRLAPNREDNHYVLVARLVGVAQAVLMIGGALYLVHMQSKTLQDTANVLTALTAGGLLGLYLFGFATTRGDGRAVAVGIVCTLVFSLWMALSVQGWLPEALKSPIHGYYAGLLGHILMFVVSFVVASLFTKPRHDLTNLTIWTQDDTPIT